MDCLRWVVRSTYKTRASGGPGSWRETSTTGRVLIASPTSANQISRGWGSIEQVENLLFSGARARDIKDVVIGEVYYFSDALWPAITVSCASCEHIFLAVRAYRVDLPRDTGDRSPECFHRGDLTEPDSKRCCIIHAQDDVGYLREVEAHVGRLIDPQAENLVHVDAGKHVQRRQRCGRQRIAERRVVGKDDS